MSDDKDTKELFERIHNLSSEAIKLCTKCNESMDTVSLLLDLHKKIKNPHVAKALMGRIRDAGCDMIAYGQNLRRQADLIEPVVDEELKGETPT